MNVSEHLLIAGLGNPGINYHGTRHNLGAIWVQSLCNKYSIALKINNKLHANIGLLQHNNSSLGKNIICMLSTNYMNLNGRSVSLVVKYYKLPIENVLIIHDELDLAPGIIKLKLNGGHAGHNGLRNVIEELDSNQFKRLRIGIGHPQIKQQVANYVLSKPEEQEKVLIDNAILNSLDLLLPISKLNWQATMECLNQLNKGKITNGI